MSGPALIPVSEEDTYREQKLSKSVWRRRQKKQKLDPPEDIMYLGFQSCVFLVAVPKGVGTFKQMAAVAMDKNGNP